MRLKHALSLWNKLWKIVDKCIYVKAKNERQFKLRSLGGQKACGLYKFSSIFFRQCVYVTKCTK